MGERGNPNPGFSVTSKRKGDVENISFFSTAIVLTAFPRPWHGQSRKRSVGRKARN